MGLVYGPVAGAVITGVGAMLGAVAACWPARHFGSPFVRRFLTLRRSDGLMRWADRQKPADKHGAGVLSNIAFNLINFAAALAGIGWWTVLPTTGLGIRFQRGPSEIHVPSHIDGLCIAKIWAKTAVVNRFFAPVTVTTFVGSEPANVTTMQPSVPRHALL